MPLRMIGREQWRGFCDRVSKRLVDHHAETAIASLGLGSQVEAQWLPLLGVAYDPKGDLVEIGLQGLDHRVRRPHQLYADEGPTGLAALVILDDDGLRHEVRLRQPLRV
jgi:uncharacterized protein DUF5335